MAAVLRPELQPRDTPPHDPLLSISGPCAALVGAAALPAHQPLRQGAYLAEYFPRSVLPLLSAVPSACWPAGPSPPAPAGTISRGDDSRVVVLHVALRQLRSRQFFLHLLADAVCGDIGLAAAGRPPCILLVGQDVADHLIRTMPWTPLCGGASSARVQFRLDLAHAAPVQVPPVDPPHRLAPPPGHDLRLDRPAPLR